MSAPFDEAAEHAVLGVMLSNPSALAVAVRELAAEDFYRGREAGLFATMAAMHTAGEPVDAVTVSTRLPKQRDYIHSLLEGAFVAANVTAYAKAVRATAVKRRLTQTLLAAQERVAKADDATAALAAYEDTTRKAAEQERERTAASNATRAGLITVDFSTLFDRDRDPVEWTYPDVLARGRGHAIYAVRKGMKSLFLLSICTEMVAEPSLVVVYLDYEMSLDDVRERLEDMGYGPESDLSRLRYYLFPDLPPLDTAPGAESLMAVLDEIQAQEPDHHLVVVLDTMSRAVCGEENSADTYRAFYNHTGIAFKRRGITWVRLDHSGHDDTHQRGSSAKGDDVDVVWKLMPIDNGVCLRRDVARMPWVPEKVTFRLQEEPLRFCRTDDDWPAGTAEVANLLSRLSVPHEASLRTAQTALKSVGEGRRREVIAAALRWRRVREMAPC